MVALLAFLMVSTVRYRTFKDVHLSARSLTVFAFLTLAGVAVGVATRASFVLVVYMARVHRARARRGGPRPQRAPRPTRPSLPPAVRAELDADEALEPEPEDVDGDKPQQDEYI